MAGVLVVIPTFNERASLPGVLERMHRVVPGADVLVVDDGSPDGTGEWAEEFADANPWVSVLHRQNKQGLGAAYVAGFTHALASGAHTVVEMDADGSHRPEDLPFLLNRLAGEPPVDLVIGSRWVPGGRVQNWPWNRQLLSRGGNVYTRLALGISVRDATAGFRAYRAEMLSKIDLSTVSSQGYCFQVDMTRRVLDAGGKVAEVPIVFVERELGTSKMNRGIVTEAVVKVAQWGWQRRTGRISDRLRRQPN